MHVNDRAKDNMLYNKSILSTFTSIDDIVFFDGNAGNAWDILNHMNVPLNTWKPYDGRATDPLPGEYGVWLSTFYLFQYICKNNIKELLVLEDDIILEKDFITQLDLCLNELPEDYDFLSLYYFDGQNTIDSRTEIGLKYIHRSLNQYAGCQATLYSLRGAKKLLKAMKRKGMEYTNDCFIFNQSHTGTVHGYSIKPNNLVFLKHDNNKITSLIDPKNFRNT